MAPSKKNPTLGPYIKALISASSKNVEIWRLFDKQKIPYGLGSKYGVPGPMALFQKQAILDTELPTLIVSVEQEDEFFTGVEFPWPAFGDRSLRLPFTLVVAGDERQDPTPVNELDNMDDMGILSFRVSGQESTIDDLILETQPPLLPGLSRVHQDSAFDTDIHSISFKLGTELSPCSPCEYIERFDAWSRNNESAFRCHIDIKWQVEDEILRKRTPSLSCPAFSRIPEDQIRLKILRLADESEVVAD